MDAPHPRPRLARSEAGGRGGGGAGGGAGGCGHTPIPSNADFGACADDSAARRCTARSLRKLAASHPAAPHVCSSSNRKKSRGCHVGNSDAGGGGVIGSILRRLRAGAACWAACCCCCCCRCCCCCCWGRRGSSQGGMARSRERHIGMARQGQAAGGRQAAAAATCAPAHRPVLLHRRPQWQMLRCCNRAAAGGGPPWRACRTAWWPVSRWGPASICNRTAQPPSFQPALACRAAAAWPPCAVPQPATCHSGPPLEFYELQQMCAVVVSCPGHLL